MMISKGVASALLTAFLSMPACALAEEGPKAMLHGNYCGPGNNAPLAPIDALDAACARHDACTPDDGLPSKACNLRLQAEAEGVAQDPAQPADLRALAGVVASGAAMMPFEASTRPPSPAGDRRTEDPPAVLRPDRDENDEDVDPVATR